MGQNGLVANVAKYLDGRPVIGIDPEPGRNAGVLITHDVRDLGDLVRATDQAQERTMVRAALDDGQHLLPPYQVFVGHRGHPTARYELAAASSGCRGPWSARPRRARDHVERSVEIAWSRCLSIWCEPVGGGLVSW